MGPLNRVAAIVLVLVLVPCGAPILEAREDGVPPTDPTGAAEDTGSVTDEDEKGKDYKDDKADKKEKKGPSFIPIPIFITEPAIGYGLGAAVAFFHKKKTPEAAEGPTAPAFTATSADKVGKGQKVPPTVTGVAAAYTDKGTWGVGVGHSASWKQDRMRYKGAFGYAHIVSTFYFDNQPYDFKLNTGLFYQELKFRIRDSDFFVGGRLVYVNPDLVFDDDFGNLPVEPDDKRINDFGLALQADYDGRDNTMTPNRGQYVEFVGWKHIEALGGDTDYWKLGLEAQSFHEMANKKLVLGFHLDLDTAGGDPPLWGYPWITLRGVPALRYQNESTAVLDTELRWNILERWAAVGFVGVGATRGDVPVFEDESGIVAGGIGGRFLFRPQDSLWVGVDIARGPEDWVFYVQIGQAWN